MEISKFDGFRVEIDESNHRADIVLSRPPLNVVLFSQRKIKKYIMCTELKL